MLSDDENKNLNGESDHTNSPSPTPKPIGCVILDQNYIVMDSLPEFLKILAEYCNLCSMLPVITVELGLKTAEMIK